MPFSFSWATALLVAMSALLVPTTASHAASLEQFRVHAPADGTATSDVPAGDTLAGDTPTGGSPAGGTPADETEADHSAPDHSAFGNFLSIYLVESGDGINRVRYGSVTPEDAAALSGYVELLSGTDPTSLTRAEAFAYWVNFYNALTVKVILDNYPVASIRDIRTGLRAGPWRRELVTVNGTALSLDDMEHNILRKFWSEPRVHYAVNCASIGCPNLSRVPFDAGNTEALLDAGARAYVNHPRGVTVRADGRLELSSIYKWFREDFGSTEDAIIDHLAKHANPDLATALAGARTTRGRAIAGHDYDWSLNDHPDDQ